MRTEDDQGKCGAPVVLDIACPRVILLIGVEVYVDIDKIVYEIDEHIEKKGDSHADEDVQEWESECHEQHEIRNEGIGLHASEPISDRRRKKPRAYRQRTLVAPDISLHGIHVSKKAKLPVCNR